MGGFFSKEKRNSQQSALQSTPNSSSPQVPNENISNNNDNNNDFLSSFQITQIDECTDYQYKVLFLGPGESGKSTFWRQIRFLFTTVFSSDEALRMKSPIKVNIISDIQAIISCMLREDHYLSVNISNTTKNNSTALMDLRLVDDELVPEVADILSQVWQDSDVHRIYDEIKSTELADHSDYFFDNVQRIAQNDYLPTKQDILFSRIRTTGINELFLKISDKKVDFVDVGGQSCERKKYRRLFTNVSAFVFMVSLSEFDQVLFEDNEINRSDDSLELFQMVAGNPEIKKPFYLIFNKVDLLQEKLKTKADLFTQKFTDFTGNIGIIEDVIEYFKKKYLNAIKEKIQNGLKIEVYSLCAVNEDNLREVFAKLLGNIINK